MTRRVNIVDPHQISGWLAAEQAEGDGTIAWWLEIALLSSLKRREESAVELKALPKDAPEWLVNKWDTCGPFHEFRPDAALADKVRHIKDWLVSAKLHDEDFLRDVDEEGRPKKLVQLDLEGAYNAADKYFERLRQKFGAVAVDDGDVETVMRLDGGYRIVRLLTSTALKAEGAGMGHCIGGGSYDDRLVSGSHEYYSLRDATNKPHATFEVRHQGNALTQCKGKENKPPVGKYMPMVRAFVKERKFALKEGPSYTGLMQDAAGSYHAFHFYPMPERLLRESDPRSGNLWQPYGAPHDLPDELTVKGAMSFGGCMRLEALPKRLYVGGTTNLQNCTGLTDVRMEKLVSGEDLLMENCVNMTSLSGNVYVNRGIWLNDCQKLETVSGEFVAAEGMDFKGCEKLTSLSGNFFVGGNLNLEACTNLTTLPETLFVGGDLQLNDCEALERLPEGIVVRKSLRADGTALTTLPKGLALAGTLSLKSCRKLQSLPDDLIVGETLDLDGCWALTRLPARLNVNNLVLGDCADLTALPEELVVRNYLVILNCPGLQRLPDSVSQARRISLYDCTGLTELPGNLLLEELRLAGCANLRSLPEDLVVTGDLNIKGCTSLKALPDGMQVGGSILSDLGVFTDVKSARAAFEAKFGKDAPSSAPKGPKV